MRINKLSLIAVLALGGLVACGTIATAQDAKDGKKKEGRRMPAVEQRLDRMTEQLKLTDEQKPKVKAVLEDGSKKMQDVRSAPPEERREKMQGIRDEEDKKIKAILTPEQTEKWDKMRSERRKGGPGGAGGATKGDTKKE